MDTEKIRWLHISDLHILLNSPSWEDYKNSILQYFSKTPSQKPHFVVITGDYRNIKKEESFELAEEFICKMMSQLELNITSDLFLVPGNHDIEPQKSSTGVPDRRTNDLQRLLPSGLSPWQRVKEDDEDIWLEKHKKDPTDYLDRLCNITRMNSENENAVFIAVLEKGFEKYQRMAKRLIAWYSDTGYGPETPHIRKWEKDSVPGLNIVHLNTALVADGGRGHFQALDLTQAKEIFYKINNGLPTLVLAHNSFYDLHPQIQEQLVQPMSAARVFAWLCGDEHKFDVGKKILCPTGNGSYSIPIYVCGKGAPDHGDNYSENGFILYNLDEKNITAQRFTWSQTDGLKEKSEITEPLATPECCPTVSKNEKHLLIGYLSCNPDLKAEDKYHLGHAYFIHSIDERRKKNSDVMILTSSCVFTHNRSFELMQSQREYVEKMIQRWEDCFERQVKIVDIKQYLQEDNSLDKNEKKLLQYVTEIEMKLDRNPEWMSFIESWNKTGDIKDIAYDSFIKILNMEDHPTTYTKNEVMSFLYLLYKRPSWYSSAWLVNFLHFWNVQLYPLIKNEFGFEVDANNVFIIEAQRNHYVWDAISYCAKRFSYTNFPKVEYLKNLLDVDCRQPMKSSNKDKAVFLAEHKERTEYSGRFIDHIAEMFDDKSDPNKIAEEYGKRLGLSC